MGLPSSWQKRPQGQPFDSAQLLSPGSLTGTSPTRHTTNTGSNEARKTMAKFSGTNDKPLRTNLTAPVRTRAGRVLTHERGIGYARDAESDLFLLAATNMVGEETFYEDAATRASCGSCTR